MIYWKCIDTINLNYLGGNKKTKFLVKFLDFRTTLRVENKFMDLIITSTIRKLRWLPSLLAFFMFTASHAFETKRFDAPPPKRSSYLSFASPKKLRFAPAPFVADRGALLMSATITPAEGGKSMESNATLEESEFPVVDYADSPSGETDIADSGEFEIPQIAGLAWYRAIDTALPSPQEIASPDQQVAVQGNSYLVTGRSIVTLVSRAST